MANAPFQSFPESFEDEGDRSRSRIRMTARSLSQRSGPAVAGNQIPWSTPRPSCAARAASSSASGMVLPAAAAALTASTAGVKASIIVLSPGRALVCRDTARRPASKRLGEVVAVHRIPGQFDIPHAGKECSQKAAGGASIDTEHSPAGGLEQIREALACSMHPSNLPFAQPREAWWFRDLHRRRWNLIPSTADAHSECRPRPGQTCSRTPSFRYCRSSNLNHCFTKKGASAGASHSSINSGSMRAISI